MLEIEYQEITPEDKYNSVVEKVINECYEEEKLDAEKLYICVTITNNENIKKTNKEYRNIDRATDVLSFPMFEKQELEKIKNRKLKNEEIIGDIVISIETVNEQAKEYGHSIDRELAYMVVHGFFHLMGYDHIEENEKKDMREKEEKVLAKLNLTRNESIN